MKLPGLVALGAGIILVLAGWKLTHPNTRDPFAFLNGHEVQDVAVQGPGSWPAAELRSYSWKQSWESVVAEARKQLPSHGLNEQPKRMHDGAGVTWLGKVVDGGLCGLGSDRSVIIAQGRSRPLRYTERLSDGDPEWVTVIVRSDLDENWINILRYTFFSMGE